MRVRPAAAAVLLGLVLGTTACSGHHDLVGAWSDPSGTVLPDGSGADRTIVVGSFLASHECEGRKDTVFLELAWPIGQPANLDDPGGWDKLRFYVQGDTVEHRIASEPFDDDVTLPVTAASTGFTREGNSISVDITGPAYVTRPDGRTERWPQIALGCA